MCVDVHIKEQPSWSIFQPNLSPSGKVIDLTPNFMSLASSIAKKVTLAKQRLVPFIVSGNANDLAFMVDLVKEGKIRTIIDSKHPLEKAEDAWAKSMEGHATGKIVVTFGE